jgi:hypothetical protein
MRGGHLVFEVCQAATVTVWPRAKVVLPRSTLWLGARARGESDHTGAAASGASG